MSPSIKQFFKQIGPLARKNKIMPAGVVKSPLNHLIENKYNYNYFILSDFDILQVIRGDERNILNDDTKT